MALHGFNKRLTWHDFKKITESVDGQFDATTAVNLAISWHGKQARDQSFFIDKVSVTISFDRLHSWVVKGKENDDLLKHEQLHYEIAAIAGRTLEARLLTLTAGTADELKTKVADVSDEIAGQTSADGRIISEGVVGAVQARYDDDAVCGSDHSRNAANQAIWQQRITKAIQKKTSDIAELDSCPRLSVPPQADAGVVPAE